MVLILACALVAEEDTADSECVRTPPLDYENFGAAWLTKHCLGCHSSLLPEERREGAPIGVDFDTYERVLQWAPSIESLAVGEAPSMPPGGGPSAEELARLTEWLHCEVAVDRERLQGGG